MYHSKWEEESIWRERLEELIWREGLDQSIWREGTGPICCGQCVKVGIVSALKSPQKGEGAQPTCPFPAKSLQWKLDEFAAKFPHDDL